MDIHTLSNAPAVGIFCTTAKNILAQDGFVWLAPEEIERRISLIEKAYNFAHAGHAGQTRKDGQDYFSAHIESVSRITLRELTHPTSTKVIIALLHDVVEDCDVSLDEIEAEFWKDIADAVSLLTKEPLSHYVPHDIADHLTPEELDIYCQEHKQTLKKDLNQNYFGRLRPSHNSDAINVKIADRIHNLRTMIWSGNLDDIAFYVKETEKHIITWLENLKESENYRQGIDRLKTEIAHLKIFVEQCHRRQDMIASFATEKV